MQLWLYIVVIALSVSFCEFLGDYSTLLKCQWPSMRIRSLEGQNLNSKILHAMVIADTHLLGPMKGHWLDKLYREWHMKRSFQASMLLHRPNVVFVLGDLFDEGDMVDHNEFNKYVMRFHSIFRTPSSVAVISAVGNHDVGFHYKMHPYFIDRFETYFKNTGVNMYTIFGNHFVVINSMAMENDGCELCKSSINQLRKLADSLNCLKQPEHCTNTTLLKSHKEYSRPILLQHFPTYRVSDKSCQQYDAPHIEIYRERWEVLSKTSTDMLGKLLHPRLVLSGHTHHYCNSTNRWGIEEYTVASFNWRNKINPSFLMVSLTPLSHEVYKCDMLPQQLVYNTYIASFLVLVSLFLWDCIKAKAKYILNKNN